MRTYNVVNPSGLAFWATASYAGAGCLSGAALGRDWLRHANEIGVANWAMLLPAIGLLSAAVSGRMALRQSGRYGALVDYCSLICWAALFAAAALSMTGLHGRLGDSAMLTIAHLAAQLLAVVFGVTATARTASMVSNFEKMAKSAETRQRKAALIMFRVPGSLLYAAGVCAIALVAMNLYSPETGYPVAWVVCSVALSGALLRIVCLFPNRKPERTARGQQISR